MPIDPDAAADSGCGAPRIEYILSVPGMPPILPPGFTIPPGTPLPDFQATGRTPLLDFIETFIVRFAEGLDQKGLPVTNNIKAVMGGSLGGNMTFRLGRRAGVPWMPRFIAWSPASIWNSLGEGSDLFKHVGVRTAWQSANAASMTPGAGDRAAFFGGWDKAIVPVINSNGPIGHVDERLLSLQEVLGCRRPARSSGNE